MAANRASAQQGLTIALIVFVMLTFILAVTTYLFFKKASDADTAMTAANADSSKAKQEMQKVAEDRGKLLGILGFPEDFEKKYGDFRDDQKAYLKLSDWLLGAVKSKDEALKTLQAEKLAMETGKDQALADSRNRQNELEQLLKKQEADAEAERSEFNKGREQYEELTARLQADLKKANEASDRMKLLVEEIAKGEPLVAVDQQAKFKAAKAEGQVTQLFDELRKREGMIARQNEILADLRVADKGLQDMVLAATPGRLSPSTRSRGRCSSTSHRRRACARAPSSTSTTPTTRVRRSAPRRPWSRSKRSKGRTSPEPASATSRHAIRSLPATAWPRACGAPVRASRRCSWAMCRSIGMAVRTPTTSPGSWSGAVVASSRR